MYFGSFLSDDDDDGADRDDAGEGGPDEVDETTSGGVAGGVKSCSGVVELMHREIHGCDQTRRGRERERDRGERVKVTSGQRDWVEDSHLESEGTLTRSLRTWGPPSLVPDACVEVRGER